MSVSIGCLTLWGMRTKGSPDELEHRRQLAVQRYLEGYSADEIAEFLSISSRTVWRWLASFRDRGPGNADEITSLDRTTRPPGNREVISSAFRGPDCSPCTGPAS
jgi:DNA invertase Pin-like site-specific DNA recombinase